MTGFGAGEARRGGVSARVEIRSVNARFLEIRLRLPPAVQPLESEIRRRVSEFARRGKVDLTGILDSEEPTGIRLRVNTAVAGEFLAAADRLRDSFRLEGTVGLAQLLAVPGVVEVDRPEPGADPVEVEALLEALDAALRAHDAARAAEGAQLRTELEGRLEEVDRLRAEILDRAEASVLAARQKLDERLRKLAPGAPLDPGRLEQEVAILADRSDITEELVRLAAHVASGRAMLRDGSEPAGKKLEFLLQELGRETNTIGSKGADLEISRRILAMKSALEKMREQAQNVE